MKQACPKHVGSQLKGLMKNICQFAQCKEVATMCLGVSRSNPWIMHQLARGYCSTQPVKAGAGGVSMSMCDRGKMWIGRREAFGVIITKTLCYY